MTVSFKSASTELNKESISVPEAAIHNANHALETTGYRGISTMEIATSR